MKSNYEELIESILLYIPNILNGIEDTVLKLYKNNIAQAIDNIALIIEGIQWLIDGFEIINSYEVNSTDTEKLNCILKNLLGALENNDYVLLKDILKYELYPLVQKNLLDLHLIFNNKVNSIEGVL